MALIYLLLALFICLSQSQFRGDYTITTSQISSTEITVEIEDGTEVQECTCDITKNNCDISCCGDTDGPDDTLELWLDDATAFGGNVILEELKPLTKGINRDYLAFWNDRPGMKIDDNDSKDEIGVQLDDQEGSSTFFDKIEEDEDGRTELLERWFEWEDDSDDTTQEVVDEVTLYNIGDPIETYNSARAVRMDFPLPLLDLYGGCDFSASASFYTELDFTCSYKIVSLSECQLNLNPATYLAFPIAIDKNTTQTVTITNSSSSTGSTSAACVNSLNSIKMTFYFSEPDGAGFKIDSVSMDYTTDSSTKAVGDIIKIKVKTMFKRTGAGDEVRSGNPGYLADKRLLLATTVGSAIQLSGFRKEIASSTGTCLTSSSTLSTITTDYDFLKFNEELNYQCNVVIANTAAFTTEGTATRYQSYYMFNQFTKFGPYGTAQVSETEDWKDVITQVIIDTPTISGTVCQNMITAIQYEVIISLEGFEDDLQPYIVAINAKPLQEDVTFTAGMNLPYRVIFTNYVVLPDEIRYDKTIPYTFPPRIGGEGQSTTTVDESSNNDGTN